MFKSELADSFPNITRIKGLQFSDENVEADTQSLTETTSDQHFFADGNNHTFKLNYFSPIYYLGNPNDDSSVVDIRVFSNAAGVCQRNRNYFRCNCRTSHRSLNYSLVGHWAVMLS